MNSEFCLVKSELVSFSDLNKASSIRNQEPETKVWWGWAAALSSSCTHARTFATPRNAVREIVMGKRKWEIATDKPARLCVCMYLVHVCVSRMCTPLKIACIKAGGSRIKSARLSLTPHRKRRDRPLAHKKQNVTLVLVRCNAGVMQVHGTRAVLGVMV